MNTDVTIFTVLRSPHGRHEIFEKDTNIYKIRVGDNWQMILSGSKSTCEEYKSPGQIFKERNGISRTLNRLVRRHINSTGSVISAEDYKRIRKEKKKEQIKATKAKHDRAIAGRKASESKKKK
jgi:hypothetical protein